MQAETEGLCTIDDFDGTIIPLEILPCDIRGRSADASSIVELGKQLLHHANNGNTETVRDLMCRGAPFTTDNLGTSALHLAALNNHIETAEVLLRAGISKDARTKVDRTPLHMAAYEGHNEMVQLLLSYGAEVDSRDMLKMTPLHWSVEKEHPEVMLTLLEHGANPSSVSKFDKTPISLAYERDRIDLAQILQEEREILNVQQNPAQATEIETATKNLIKSEVESQLEENDSIVSEQQQKRNVVQATTKKQKVFQHVKAQSLSENERITEGLQKLEENSFHIGNKKQKHITTDQPLKFLQAHGITMIPVDNESTIVENAMESGQTVVLTEAGKLALNLTRSNSLNLAQIKRLQMGSKKGNARKIITIRADQFLNQNSSPVISKGPNILKRASTSENRNSGKIFLTSIGNTITALPTISSVSPTKAATSTKKVPTISKAEPILLQLNEQMQEIFEDTNDIDSSAEIAELTKKLEEVEREAEELRQQLQMKEEEVELYKQQIKNLSAQ